MGNYNEFNLEMSKLANARILIMDNNNLEFCSQNENLFPSDVIFSNYDIILIPEWVHAEISHSEKRLTYLASIPIPYFILYEEEDYFPLANDQDFRLMNLFKHASSSIGKARKITGVLDTYYKKHDDLPENWISEFYENAFEIRETIKTIDNQEVSIELKKNAGETSILVLTYLLINHYPVKIKSIAIFTTDAGTLTIKNTIMKNLDKIGLVQNSSVPISFKSTDILLIEGIKDRRIEIEDLDLLRKNSKKVVYTLKLEDSSSSRHEYVMSTHEFIGIFSSIEDYHFEF